MPVSPSTEESPVFLIDCPTCHNRTINGFSALESVDNHPVGIRVRVRCRCGATVVQHHGRSRRRPAMS